MCLEKDTNHRTKLLKFKVDKMSIIEFTILFIIYLLSS